MLGPLQDNGGPTFTLDLLPGSPAIDAGDPKFTPPPLYDQRGTPFVRVFNGRIDIGSFEVQPTPTPTPTPSATPDSDSDTHADGNSDSNPHTYGGSDAEIHSNTEASSNPTASPAQR